MQGDSRCDVGRAFTKLPIPSELKSTFPRAECARGHAADAVVFRQPPCRSRKSSSLNGSQGIEDRFCAVECHFPYQYRMDAIAERFSDINSSGAPHLPAGEWHGRERHRVPARSCRRISDGLGRAIEYATAPRAGLNASPSSASARQIAKAAECRRESAVCQLS